MYACLTDLLEVNALPRAIGPGDESHAAAVGDVGVIRDEVLHRVLLRGAYRIMGLRRVLVHVQVWRNVFIKTCWEASRI